MKTKTNFLTAIAAILFAVVSISLSSCGTNAGTKTQENQQEATEEEHHHDMDEQHAHGDMAEAHYQCPMKCEGDKTYDEPGQCPVCKMDLKKVDEHHSEE